MPGIRPTHRRVSFRRPDRILPLRVDNNFEKWLGGGRRLRVCHDGYPYQIPGRSICSPEVASKGESSRRKRRESHPRGQPGHQNLVTTSLGRRVAVIRRSHREQVAHQRTKPRDSIPAVKIPSPTGRDLYRKTPRKSFKHKWVRTGARTPSLSRNPVVAYPDYENCQSVA